MILLAASAVVSGLALADRLGWLTSGRMVEVYEKYIKDETIILDNHKYVNCTFDNVTVKWAGGDYVVIGVSIKNGMQLENTNPIAANTVSLLDSLGLIDHSKLSGIKRTQPQ